MDALSELTPSWSTYNYVQNTPIKAIDPDGNICVGCLNNGKGYSPMGPEYETDFDLPSHFRSYLNHHIGSSAWPPENGTEGQVHSDNDGTWIHDGSGWVDQEVNEDGMRNYALPSVKITPENDNSGLGLALFGATLEGARFEMYNKESWFSIYKMKSYNQTFTGNGHTGGKNKHAKFWSKTFDYAGKGLGAYQALDIINQRRIGEINDFQFIAEQGSNAFSTFGGLPGATWGIGWEGGRWLSKRDFYHEYLFLPINPGGRDGLISTRQ